MFSRRLDLRNLRLLLAVVAIMLAVVAAAPHTASADVNTGGGFDWAAGAKKKCKDAGGTWTVEGNTATCSGLGRGTNYKCHLDINPNGTACEYLPFVAPATPVKGSRVETAGNDGVSHPEPTKTPKQTQVEASDAVSQMSPLDE